MLAVASAFMVFASAGKDARAESPEYEDRLISGGELAPETVEDKDSGVDITGNPRSLFIEVGASRIAPYTRVSGESGPEGDALQQEAGISLSGRYQTDNYGLLGIDAQLRRGTSSRLFSGSSGTVTRGLMTLSSRALPLGNGWTADSVLGMTSMPAVPLVAIQQRFYIPSTPMLGGAVTLKSYERIARLDGGGDPRPVASLNLAVGEPGLLGGTRLADFTRLSGLGLSGGGQLELSPRLSVGFQAIDVENSRDPYVVVQGTGSGPEADGRFSSQAGLAMLAYRAGGLRLQANVIGSHLSWQSEAATSIRRPGDAVGGWIDASYRSGRRSQSGGVYYFGPDLAWGTSSIINNVYGAYYRIAASSQRWRWTFSADAVDTINGLGSRGVLINADVRRQLTFVSSIGINSSARRMNGDTSSQILGFVDFASNLGETRVEAGWSQAPRSDQYRLGWNQNWSLPAWLPSGSRLSTHLTFDHRRSEGNSAGANGRSQGRSDSFGAAVSAGSSPFEGVTFDATLAFNTNASTSSSAVYGPVDATGGVLGVLSSQQGQAFSATLVATARLSPRLSLSASLTDTRSSMLSSYGLSGPAQSPLGYTPEELADIQKATYRLQAAYLTLRYSLSAGRAKGVVGRQEYPGAGTGTLAGRTYLDGNGNGTRDANEPGIAGIIVFLDGIQAVRTDTAGHYRFDDVADGPHRITVNADALPLPWSMQSGGGNGSFMTTVDVGVRATTTLDIAAVRE